MCDDRELEYFGPSFLYCSVCGESRAWTKFGSVTCASARQFLCEEFGSALRWCGLESLYDALAVAAMQHGWICLECEALQHAFLQERCFHAAASRGRLGLAPAAVCLHAAARAVVRDREWLTDWYPETCLGLVRSENMYGQDGCGGYSKRIRHCLISQHGPLAYCQIKTYAAVCRSFKLSFLSDVEQRRESLIAAGAMRRQSLYSLAQGLGA
jgi:hypothetical protein